MAGRSFYLLPKDYEELERRVLDEVDWFDQRRQARHGAPPLTAAEREEMAADLRPRLLRVLKSELAEHRQRVPCGAKTRSGPPCRALSVPGKRRCRLHGGLSTGPKGAAAGRI